MQDLKATKKKQLKFDAKTKPENTAAHNMLVKMNKKTMEQLEILFRSALSVSVSIYKTKHAKASKQCYCVIQNKYCCLTQLF